MTKQNHARSAGKLHWVGNTRNKAKILGGFDEVGNLVQTHQNSIHILRGSRLGNQAYSDPPDDDPAIRKVFQESLHGSKAFEHGAVKTAGSHGHAPLVAPNAF